MKLFSICLSYVDEKLNKTHMKTTEVTTSWSATEVGTLTRTLKAIAHPVRLAIITMLQNEESLTVTQIYTRLNADQSFISHHLSILRDKNVLGTQRKGKFIHYYLKNSAYLELIDCLSTVEDTY